MKLFKKKKREMDPELLAIVESNRQAVKDLEKNVKILKKLAKKAEAS